MNHAGEVALTCGDTNGDGLLDISDPIHTLSFLFTGGPAPKYLASCDAPPGDICDEIVALRQKIAGRDGALKDILPHMSVVNLPPGKGGFTKTIRFSGVNVQIVNGQFGRRCSLHGHRRMQWPPAG